MVKRIYTQHSMTGTKIHGIWKEMKRRCKYKNIRYASYKAKKISVCVEWDISAKAFISWALKNGYKEGLQIDREDNNKGYYPKNCRFVTAKQNANNRNNNVHLTYKKQTLTLSEWSDLNGIKPHTLYTRYGRKWKTERILEKGARWKS